MLTEGPWETWGLSLVAVAMGLTYYPVPVSMAAVLVKQGISAEMITAKAIELSHHGLDDAWVDAVIASAGYRFLPCPQVQPERQPQDTPVLVVIVRPVG